MSKKIFLTFPQDLPSTYYCAIGEVVARCTLFEWHAMEAIAKLLNISDKKKMRIAIMGMQAKVRIGMLRALATKWAPTGRLQNDFSAIAKEGLKLINMRNQFTHGTWGLKEGKQRGLHVYYPDESKDFYLPPAKRYKVTEIREIARQIRALDLRLIAAAKQLA